jgi:hypothetical protein
MSSPFEVLGVSPDADDGTIRAAFRRAAKSHHPDLKHGDEVAARRFKQIAAARDAILKGPAVRSGRRLLEGPGDLDDASDTQAFDPAFDLPPVRLGPSITVGGVILALLAACVISAAMVFLSQWGVTASERAIAGALETAAPPSGPPASADEHPAAIDRPAAALTDWQMRQRETPIVPSYTLHDEPSQTAITTVPGAGGDRPAKRAAPAATAAARSSEGVTPARTAPAGKQDGARLPLQPGAASSPTAAPRRRPPRPVYAVSRCDMAGRWWPCR